MWQLVEAIEGLADACQTLSVPVTGGNVSLYNETGAPGLVDSAIHPTPVVGVLGVIEDVREAVPSGWREVGLRALLLGKTRAELDGSAWADVVHGHLGGVPPKVKLKAEAKLAGLLVALRKAGLVAAAHDLSEGGLMQALLESSLRFGVGATVSIKPIVNKYNVSDFEALFSESTARALVAVSSADVETVLAMASEAKVRVMDIGLTGGDVVMVDGLCDGHDFSIPLDEAQAAFEGTLPGIFG
jgi:phosphoribosylformylglycinamidine synthase